jgi:membrane-associated phospholipid phosphatase
MEYLYELGISIVLVIQGLGEWLSAPMKLLSFMGSAEFYLLIMPFLYWSIDTALGIRIGLILLFSDAINYYLKVAIHSGRPFWVSRQVESLSFDPYFGMPSAHAQNSAAVFGLIAATLKHRWVWVLSLLLIFLIGLSRLYLAVHFPQDVILGWLIGFLLVWIFLRVEKPVAAWFSSQSLPLAVFVLFVISISMLLVGLLIRSITSDWQIPAAWLENARLAFPEEEPINPFKFSGMLLTSGVFFGLSAGALWLSKRGGFNARGSWGRRILRYLLGVVGVAILWFGLGSLLPEDAGTLGYVLSYLLNAVIGFWISALAPLIFLRINLAEPNTSKNPAV